MTPIAQLATQVNTASAPMLSPVNPCVKRVPVVEFIVTVPERTRCPAVFGAFAGLLLSDLSRQAVQEADQERKHGQAEKHGSSVKHVDLAKVGYVGGVRAALAAVVGGGANGRNGTLSLFPVLPVVNSDWRGCP